jgi:predicted metalloprotease with PDZ domain
MILVSVVALLLAAAPPTTVSAPIADVHYDVTLDSLTVKTRSLNVAMHFRVTGPGPVVLALPAWSPGHYTLLWFSRRVSHFAPTVNGQTADWRMLDYQTWRIDAKPGQEMTVSFTYLADTVDRAVAWTRPDFGFFNGTNVFLYPNGRSFDWPATVTVHTSPSWRVATGMPASKTPNSFHAATYHELVDHPFFVGHFDLDSAAAGSHWVRFANYPSGVTTGARATRVLGWLARLAPAEGAVFDTIPWSTYTVLQITDTVVNDGGLEHEDSQLDEITYSELDAEWLPWLYSHEMFHSWNVKRLRPADLVPYRYDDAQPTGWLWVSEGITDYYADVATMRGGIGDSTNFLGGMARNVRVVAGAPPTAPADAALSPWVNPTNGSAGLYYPQGALIGFLLDICIRDASDNRASLDHVMRTLYATTYAEHRGFTPTDWWGTVSRAAGGRSFATFNKRFVEGRESLPYDSVVALAGLVLTRTPSKMIQLGVGGSPDSLGMRVEYINPNTPAATAGVQLGDHLVSFGTVALRNDSSWDALAARYGATTDSIAPLVFRHGTAIDTVPTRINRIDWTRTTLALDPNASAKAVRVRHGLFSGRTTPH